MPRGEKPGALVGKHRVRIYPQIGAEKGQDDGVVEEQPKKKAPRRRVPYVPVEWNELSTKEFEVPRGGTDKADFAIVTKAGK